MSLVVCMQEVTKSYRRRGRKTVAALQGVSLSLSSGDLRFIQGPSGSGKSTLLLCAGGLLRPDSGTVSLLGESLYELPSEARSQARARNVGFVFQQFHLIPYLNVLDNVLTPVLSGSAPEDVRLQAEALIERFGLTHRREHPPSELSIGERQRVALARALLFRPKLLLADEPTGNLDEQNRNLVMEALGDYARDGGAVLIVTHDRHGKDGASWKLQAGSLSDLS